MGDGSGRNGFEGRKARYEHFVAVDRWYVVAQPLVKAFYKVFDRVKKRQIQRGHDS
jgi:hypothetical protein